MAKEQKPMQPQEASVESKLKALYELQLVDSQIDELRIMQGELPQEVKDMADDVEGLKTRLNNIEVEMKDLETQISNKRVQIENDNASIARYKEQQDSVRNNREFDNLTKEIEYHTLDVEACQKHIRDYTANLEARAIDKEKTIKAIEEHTVDLNQKRSALNEILSDTREKTDGLVLRAQALELTIDERLLAAFKRIRKQARNGLAVATVERDACAGCRSKIPAQRQLDIRLRKKIIPCEYCGRILVDPELAASVKA